MKIPIVNEQDEIIGHKDPDERDLMNEITRIMGVWILNENNKVLIAKRSKNKKSLPNLWSHSVAGSVEEGESYEFNALKEIGEELGVNISDLTPGPKHRMTTKHAYFCQWFIVKIPSNTKFILQESEVDEIKWISIKELKEWYKNNPSEFVPSFDRCLEVIENYANKN